MRHTHITLILLLTLASLGLHACSSCQSSSETSRVDAPPVVEPPPTDVTNLEGPIPYGKNVVIDINEPPRAGVFPLIHLLRSINPRVRACSVKAGIRGIVVGETRHNGQYFLKVRTPTCTGYVPEDKVKRTGN